MVTTTYYLHFRRNIKAWITGAITKPASTPSQHGADNYSCGSVCAGRTSQGIFRMTKLTQQGNKRYHSFCLFNRAAMGSACCIPRPYAATMTPRLHLNDYYPPQPLLGEGPFGKRAISMSKSTNPLLRKKLHRVLSRDRVVRKQEFDVVEG